MKNLVMLLAFLFVFPQSLFAYDASYVIGQSLFTTSNTGTTEFTLSGPTDIEYDSDDEILYVLDTANNRVLVYDVSDITNGEAAIAVLGQEDFTNGTSQIAPDRLGLPVGLGLDEERNLLFVSQDIDTIAVFDVNSIDSGEDAVNFLGTGSASSQQNGVSFGTGTLSGMDYDEDSELLYVSDSGNNRVLVFDLAVIDDNENAVHVLGQTDYGPGFVGIGTIPDGMSSPMHSNFISSLNYLAVADGFNCLRLFDVSSITDGEPHVKVIGDDDLLTCDQLTGVTPTGRNSFPLGFLSNSGADVDESKNILYISDAFHGVLTFDITDITNGEDAISIIGQTDFDFAAIQTGTTESLMLFPMAVTVDEENDRIFVVDKDSNRVLVFEFLEMTDSSVLIGGTVGDVYSKTLVTDKDQGTVEFAVTSGALPTGLSLASDGTISGTPTVEGDYSFSVRATDVVIDDVQEFFDDESFSISIAAAAAPSGGGGGGSSGGGYILPKIFVAGDLEETTKKEVMLYAKMGRNVTRYELSNFADFDSFDMFSPEIKYPMWDVCKGAESCDPGDKTVYARFFRDNKKINEDDVSIKYVAPINHESCPVFISYAKLWDKDNDKNEVMKIQQFLNEKMGETLGVDGTFGLGTYFAVKRFQEKYYQEIIVPWGNINGLDHATGWWHRTTSAWANRLSGC